MNKTKSQQAQEYAEKVNYPCPDYGWYESDDEQMKECLKQVWLDGYTACEQSLWRSVEEKLPEDGQKVIACRKGGKDLDIWTFHKEYDGEINCFETFDCNPQWMDYWMPIPSLPKNRSNEEK